MSIVDVAGERVVLAPEPDRARPVRSEQVRQRNREWLAAQRQQDDLTVRELAKRLGVATATLGEGLLWAAEQEERDEAEAIECERRHLSPVLDEKSGLDFFDIVYLVERYPPGTELGSLPEFWEVLAPLWDKVVALHGQLPATVAA